MIKICECCNREYSYDGSQISKYCSTSCRSLACHQRKMEKLDSTHYVVCGICGLKFKEINFDHLSKHGVSKDEYDKKYGSRTSMKTRERKDTLSKILDKNLSEKLSKSHTLENYISKYGEVDGPIRHINRLKNMKYRSSIQSYIDKYGEEIGREKFKEISSKKKITLDNLINKYGEEVGKSRYESWKEKQKTKNTIGYYIEKYGKKIGIEKWTSKNDKISMSNSKVLKEDRAKFREYILQVNKFTRISINMNIIPMIEMRGVENNYDLDHRVSKIDGFNKDVHPCIIGHFSNLNIVNSSYNRKKQHKSDMEIEYLIKNFNRDEEYHRMIVELGLYKSDAFY